MVVKSFLSALLYELQPVRVQDVHSTMVTIGQAAVLLLRALGVALLSLTHALRSLSLYTLTALALWLLGAYLTHTLLDILSLYVIATLFAMIFLNLGERREGELSAYSVFNEGFQELLGTLNAEQFENEIRHRDVRGLRREGEEEEGEEGIDEEYFIPSSDSDSERDSENEEEEGGGEGERAQQQQQQQQQQQRSKKHHSKQRREQEKQANKDVDDNDGRVSSSVCRAQSILSSSLLEEDPVDEEFVEMLRRREVARKVREFEFAQWLQTVSSSVEEKESTIQTNTHTQSQS